MGIFVIPKYIVNQKVRQINETKLGTQINITSWRQTVLSSDIQQLYIGLGSITMMCCKDFFYFLKQTKHNLRGIFSNKKNTLRKTESCMKKL